MKKDFSYKIGDIINISKKEITVKDALFQSEYHFTVNKRTYFAKGLKIGDVCVVCHHHTQGGKCIADTVVLWKGNNEVA